MNDIEPLWQTRVRLAEPYPPVWAVDYRGSDLESWDTFPRRFLDLERAVAFAEQEGERVD